MDEIVSINIPEPKKISLIIDDKTYEVKLMFSINDVIELEKTNLEDDAECLRFVKTLIARHIIGNDEVDPQSIDEDSCVLYINTFLESDSALSKRYMDNDASLKPAKRFLIAQKSAYKAALSKLQSEISQIAEPYIESINRMYENLSPVIEGFKNVIEQYNNIYKDIIDGFASSISKMVQAFSDFSFPEWSEEDKQRIIDRYILWGSYGWTSTGFLPEDLLDQLPSDMEDANRIAKRYLMSSNVDLLFDRMSSLHSIKKSDVTEMKACYANKEYKGCALIGFSLIESKLIRSQGSSRVNRRVGNDGIKKLKAKYQSDIESFFLLSISAKNLFCCLEKMYEYSDHFKKQPIIINRHFLVHGMLHRKVTKRDAIQTVLAVYNLYYITEILEIANRNE